MELSKNQRFKIVREALELDQRAIGEAIGLEQGTISGIENGKSGISKRVLSGLADSFGVRKEYIMDGEEPMFDKSLIKTNPNILSEPEVRYGVLPKVAPNLYMIPIKAFGGFLSGYSNKAYLDSLEKVSFPWVRGTCFAFEIEGFSMVSDDSREESFYPGTWVVCTELENLNWLQKDKYYVFATIDGVIIKRFKKVEGQLCHIESINTAKEYKINPIPLKNIKRIFYIENKITKP
jgi:transcriptional regulator with XRE-family HTH domain